MLLPPPLAWLVGFDVEVDRSKLEARLVGEAMTTPALTIEAHLPVSLAARRMIERGVNRLPVVEDGKLVGIVTRADLVRAFVRSDAEIAREIREDVVVRRLRLDEHSVQVEVEDGEVTLTGTLDDRADAQSLEELVSKVPASSASTPSWPGPTKTANGEGPRLGTEALKVVSGAAVSPLAHKRAALGQVSGAAGGDPRQAG